jgi:mycofactocin biosynthesis protein MftB
VSVSATSAFDASAPWQLSEQVSLRDEAFGALAYHHVNRRLVFLKSRELVAIVRSLSSFSSAHEAIDAHVDSSQHQRYVSALSSLFNSELLSGR